MALDLKTGKNGFIDHKDWDRGSDKRYSPDSLHYLSVNKSAIPYKIRLHDIYGQQKIVVKNAAHGPSTSDAEFPDITTTWLNNHCFLYSVHNPIGYDSNCSIHPGFFVLSQISRVTLRTFEISGSEDREFFVLDTVHSGEVNDRFLKDNIGQLIYRTTGFDYYLVDTLNKRLIEYPFYELDKGFSISNRSDKDGHIIRYKDSVIGRIWGTSPVVTENAIAVEYALPGSNLGYPKGIKVWTNYTKSWVTIDFPWISALIGWISEDEKEFGD